MHLIVGATGMLGGEICRLLAGQGKAVRALARETSDSEKVARLKDLGAEVVRGDLKDAGSLDAACRGVSAVISTASSTTSKQEGDSIVTDRAPITMEAKDGTCVEVFEWASHDAIEAAHTQPVVLRMWEEYGKVCDYTPI